MNHLLHQLLRLRTKCEFNALGSSEQVGDNRNRAPFHAVEQEGWAAAIDDAAVDFRDLEEGIDFGVDCEQVALLTQNLEKLAEISNRHGRRRETRRSD